MAVLTKEEAGFIAFGEEEPEAVSETAMGTLSSFLENEALSIVAVVVVLGFLAYQFGSWYLAGGRFTSSKPTDQDLRDRP